MVYLQFNRSVEYGEYFSYNETGNTYTKLQIESPNEELPDDPYKAYVWIDYTSENRQDPIEVGTVLACTYSTPTQPLEIPADAVFSFGPEITE